MQQCGTWRVPVPEHLQVGGWNQSGWTPSWVAAPATVVTVARQAEALRGFPSFPSLTFSSLSSLPQSSLAQAPPDPPDPPPAEEPCACHQTDGTNAARWPAKRAGRGRTEPSIVRGGGAWRFLPWPRGEGAWIQRRQRAAVHASIPRYEPDWGHARRLCAVGNKQTVAQLVGVGGGGGTSEPPATVPAFTVPPWRPGAAQPLAQALEH